MDKFINILGARTAKTAIAITISTFFASIIYGNDYVAFAPFAAIIVLTDTVYVGVSTGVYRILGTIFGGLFTFFLLTIGVNQYIVLSFGIVILFRILVKLKLQSAVSIAGFVLIAMSLSPDKGMDLFYYGVNRVGGTIIGIVVANIINILIYPPNASMKLEDDMIAIADLTSYLKDKIMYSSADMSIEEFHDKFADMEENYHKLINEIKYLKITKTERDNYELWKRTIDNSYHLYKTYSYLKKEGHCNDMIKQSLEYDIQQISTEIEKIKIDILEIRRKRNIYIFRNR